MVIILKKKNIFKIPQRVLSGQFGWKLELGQYARSHGLPVTGEAEVT